MYLRIVAGFTNINIHHFLQEKAVEATKQKRRKEERVHQHQIRFNLCLEISDSDA
jgi:hypothetical protein